MTVLSQRFGLAAFLWCAAVGAVLAFAPVMRSTSCSATSERPQSVCVSESHSLVESEGAAVLGLLALPTVATGLPLAFRRRAIAIAGAGGLSVLVLLGIASIGLLLVPAAGLAWCAVATARPPHPSAA